MPDPCFGDKSQRQETLGKGGGRCEERWILIIYPTFTSTVLVSPFSPFIETGNLWSRVPYILIAAFLSPYTVACCLHPFLHQQPCATYVLLAYLPDLSLTSLTSLTL